MEDCFPFSIRNIRNQLKYVAEKGGVLKSKINWAANGQKIGAMSYGIIREGNSLKVSLSYKISGVDDAEIEVLDFPIYLEYTVPNFGGKRYWFICPGLGCYRRVGKLFLPPYTSHFKCRICHDLTYLSSRESHRWDSLFNELKIDRPTGNSLRKRMGE